MILTMAEIGIHPKMLTLLLQISGEKIERNLIKYLEGPIIHSCSEWNKNIPDWLYSAIPSERLEIVLKDHENGSISDRVGVSELTIVLMAASLETPLQYEYSDIYLWAASHAYAKHKEVPFKEVQKLIGHSVNDKDIIKNNGKHHQAYRHICKDIRDKVVHAASKRKKGKSK